VNLFSEGRVVKKTYEKPKLAAAARLAKTTAVLGRGISYYVPCGAEGVWDPEDEICIYPAGST
jgi:hypothetical protein